jgi:cation-transporting ATPase E
VVRAGVPRQVRVDQIVLDDVIELRAGDQVPVDGLALSANGLEIDESLLTGESEPVAKQLGDEVLSGSLVVAGNAWVQAVRVAGDSYARGLAAEARRFAMARSEIRDGIDRILAYVTWLLVPTAVLLLVTQIIETEAGWRDAVATSVGAVVGMVPEGLILLTTIALATAMVRLGRRHVLVQELPAVEMLARADVVCFDKTGTLTDGHIEFERLVPVADLPRPIAEDVHKAIGSLAGLELNPNASVRAIAIHFADAQWKPTVTVPFSSARKWSAATFQDHGSWILGAPEILLRSQDGCQPLAVEADHIASAGRRVLALGYSSQTLASTSEPALPEDMKPVALVVLAERIRSDAVATLRYLTEQGVLLKVLSGDNPRTVATIAAAAGVLGAEGGLSGAEVSDDPDQLMDAAERMIVFGRVSPHQKRDLVAALRRRGHTVAMLGDGINDALALKEADIGIAMGSGTAATRAAAQVVLLSDEFAALPPVIAEGRRVVANVERTANLFLAKTSYVLLMALAIGEAGVEYPFLRLASPVTVTRFLPFDVRRFLSILAQGRYLRAYQMSVAGLED